MHWSIASGIPLYATVTLTNFPESEEAARLLLAYTCIQNAFFSQKQNRNPAYSYFYTFTIAFPI